MEVVARRLTGLLLESVGLPEVRSWLLNPYTTAPFHTPLSSSRVHIFGRFGGLPDVARE